MLRFIQHVHARRHHAIDYILLLFSEMNTQLATAVAVLYYVICSVLKLWLSLLLKPGRDDMDCCLLLNHLTSPPCCLLTATILIWLSSLKTSQTTWRQSLEILPANCVDYIDGSDRAHVLK